MKPYKMRVVVNKVLEVYVMAKDEKDANYRVVNAKASYGIMEKVNDVDITYGAAKDLDNKTMIKKLNANFKKKALLGEE